MKNPPLHRYATRPGLYFTNDGGADAVVRSETADRIWLCVYEPLDRPSAFYNEAVRLFKGSPIPWTQEVRLFPICSRIIESMYVRETLFAMSGPNYGLWYVHLPKAWDGMRYAYRVDGQWNPTHDVRFNPHKILLDPYGKGIDGTMKLDASAFSYECTIDNGVVHGSPDGNMSTLDSLGSMPVSVAIDDRDTTKHEGEPSHPHVPWSKTVIYELHVKGFTANAPWLPPELRGTYAGLAHPATLSYLQTLGVTSIELLPIQAKQDELFLQQRGRHNYWGYSTLGYFAPEPSYATQAAQRSGPRAVRQEVIDMVRALHEAGFEVIMDVVYNHTCEGGTDGPTVCWRGLDELSYYRHQRNNPSRLEDTTGCGNTLDFSNTHVVTFAIDSLRYWAKRIGVDGFRFDLAASLARLDGNFTKHHPFLYALRSDMLLGNLKLIMEPWDVGYQGWRTGQFGMPFGEWNDAFRNSVRQFWLTDPVDRPGNGETGMQEMATRLCGSADLFATEPGRGAPSSINFISCHDGFTTADLTAYARKHNEDNGEDNNDGSNVNYSVNFGHEGPSDDPAINQHRERATLNLLGTLLLSLGTPMLQAGDEFGNSQQGNNNAYCQDNDITWLQWDWMDSTGKNSQLRIFESVSRLISARKSLSLFHTEDFYTRLTQIGLFKQSSRVQWFLPDGTTPVDSDWSNPTARRFTMRLIAHNSADLLIIINGDAGDCGFRLPADSSWQTVWSSAQAEGIEPAPGTKVSVAQHSPDMNWMAMHLTRYPLSDVIAQAQNTPHDSTSAMTPPVPSVIAQSEATEQLRAPHQGVPAGTNAQTGVAGDADADADVDTTGNVASPGTALRNTAKSATQHHDNHDDAKPEQESWMVPEYSITLMQQIKPKNQAD